MLLLSMSIKKLCEESKSGTINQIKVEERKRVELFFRGVAHLINLCAKLKNAKIDSLRERDRDKSECMQIYAKNYNFFFSRKTQ